MKYMLMRKADADTEKGVLPSEEVLQAMADYNERMLNAGIFVSGEGLRPSREGCRIQLGEGEPLVTDGPFSETRELLAGFTVLEVESMEEAIAWAKQWPPEDGHATLELRRFYGVEDFNPGPAIDKHKAMGEQLARMPAEMNVHVPFDGNCRDAMAFYADVIGGHLESMITFGETPAAEDTPEDWHDRIVHASLNIRGRRLMGADMAGECYTRPQGVQVHLEFEDPERAGEVFARLADGGHIIMPFEQTFWAYRFGMTTDRFGLGWMISCGIEH